jgi:hypothetical protein
LFLQPRPDARLFVRRLPQFADVMAQVSRVLTGRQEIPGRSASCPLNTFSASAYASDDVLEHDPVGGASTVTVQGVGRGELGTRVQ